MMKKWLAVLVAVILCLTLSVPALAQSLPVEELPRLVDNADLLSAAEETALLARLDEVSAQHGVDLIVLTEEDIDGLTPEAYANRYYDDNLLGQGDNRDGVLLLLSMAERDWYILTNGLGHTAITDDEVQSIGEWMLSDLSEGNYASAFNTFVNECEYEINGEINGFPFKWGQNLIFSLIVGFVVALIVTGVMKRKLKSVVPRVDATEYTVQGSMRVTEAGDLYLYRTVDRTRRVQDTSRSSGGGGGGSRGGGGGKF